MVKKLLRRKDGFTLVEVIVVLVILAILAAILIPTLTGYIDRANQRAVIAETRSAVMAAQTIASEAYAVAKDNGNVTVAEADVKTLSEVKGTISNITVTGGKVTGLTYVGNGWQCIYADGAYGTPTQVAKG